MRRFRRLRCSRPGCWAAVRGVRAAARNGGGNRRGVCCRQSRLASAKRFAGAKPRWMISIGKTAPQLEINEPTPVASRSCFRRRLGPPRSRFATMTAGAVTLMLDRLEELGYLIRSRTQPTAARRSFVPPRRWPSDLGAGRPADRGRPAITLCALRVAAIEDSRFLEDAERL